MTVERENLLEEYHSPLRYLRGVAQVAWQKHGLSETVALIEVEKKTHTKAKHNNKLKENRTKNCTQIKNFEKIWYAFFYFTPDADECMRLCKHIVEF